MLKSIILKGKLVPVPIPILNLHQAIEWVSNDLISKGQIVTRVLLDNIDSDDLGQKFSAISLDGSSQLEFKVDSPKDLALQILDSMHQLCNCLYDMLQPLAIDCWQTNAADNQLQLLRVQEDLSMVLELSDHLVGLIDASHMDAAPVQGVSRLLIRVIRTFSEKRQSKDWRSCARLLLNRIEPLLKELIKESENLQFVIYSSHSEADETQAAG